MMAVRSHLTIDLLTISRKNMAKDIWHSVRYGRRHGYVVVIAILWACIFAIQRLDSLCTTNYI